MFKDPRLIAGAALCLAMCAGCQPASSRPKVQGSVTYKGQVVAGQTLTLYYKGAEPGDFFAHRLQLQVDGSFSGEAPQPAMYKVLIEPPLSVQEGQSSQKLLLIPEKYRTAMTTPLEWTVQAGANFRDFELSD